MGRKIEQAEIDKFLEAVADGIPYSTAAGIVGISRETARKYVTEFAEKIEQLQLVGEEALMKRYRMRKEDEIVAVGTLLEMIRGELLSNEGAKIKEMTATELIRAYKDLRAILPVSKKDDDEDNPFGLFDSEESIQIIARRRLRRVQFPPPDDEDAHVEMEFDEE